MRVLVSGNAGSGKSTVARAVVEEFKLKRFSGGEASRRIAKKLGFKTSGEEFLEFHDYVKKHPGIDREIDGLISGFLEKDDCVVDSRLAPHLYKKEAYRVYLKAPLEVAAERNAKREGISRAEALKAVSKRNQEDAERYNKLYNVDISDLSVYDLVLDTSYFSIKEMNSVIIYVLRKVLKQ
ncbi:AAA family ATPase [archaeon]|nr:AAA family ATPase [archaeon]